MRIIHSNYRFFSPFNGIKGVIDDNIGNCYDASPHNTSITVGYWNPIGNNLKEEFLNSVLKFNSPEYSPNGISTNNNTNNDIGNIYEKLGIKKGEGNVLTVIRRCFPGPLPSDSQTDCIVDGFLGYENQEDFYSDGGGLIGENYNEANITYNTNDIDKKLDGQDSKDGRKYKLRSPAFWTHTKPSKSAGAFSKIREVYAYGAYGLINGQAQSGKNPNEDWIRPYDYNEIRMIDLLSDTFFARGILQQIYTI